MKLGGLVLVGVMVAGCTEDAATLSSGERLHLAWHAFDDGSRQLDTSEVFDAERGEACTPRPWTDGASYCTPGGRDLTLLSTVYADAGCDAAVVRAMEGAPPAYVPTMVGGAIAALHRAEPVTLDAFWIRNAGGTCAGPYAGSGQRFARRGVEVSSAELAPVASRVIDDGGRIGLRAHVTDGGLSLPHAMRDTSHGFDCIVRTTASGVATCLPPRQATLRFADAGCREPVVGQHESWPDVSPYMFAGPVCAPLGFMVGIELSTAPGYELIDGACRATPAPVGHRWFQAATIDLAHVQRRRVATPGLRLEAIELVAGDLVLDDGNRFDSGTGGECHLASSAAEPGVRRCLPQDPGYEHTYYADAACSRPVPLANVYRQAPMAKCGADLPPFAIGSTPGVYLRIKGSQAAPVFRRDESGACTASPYAGLAGAPLLFELGEPVALGEFVAAHPER